VEKRLKRKLRKLNTQINTGLVPLVQSSNYSSVLEEVSFLDSQIRNRKYSPEIPVGYLGLEKNGGVTRFIPILSRSDTLVYFATTYRLEKHLFKKVIGVQGAYQNLPNSIVNSKGRIDVIKLMAVIDSLPYSVANMVDPSNWLIEWQEFVEFTEKAIESTPSNFKIMKSDIANFYDSINIDKLRDKLFKRLAEMQADITTFEEVEYLENYLRYYDRRLNGYRPSSKGLPQEYMSDASRLLSNFYLYDFDIKFQNYCRQNDILYTRFADDFILFGKNKTVLERALHNASRYLLQDGLNLSAPKTQFYTKKQYQIHRGLNVLKAIDTGNQNKIGQVLRHTNKAINSGMKVRTDTIVKRLLTTTENGIIKLTPAIRQFITKYSSDVDTLNHLGFNYVYKRALLEKNIGKFLEDYCNSICKKPFAYPKASFLQLIRKKKASLLKNGITIEKLQNWVYKIHDCSSDSQTLMEYCIPETLKSLSAA